GMAAGQGDLCPQLGVLSPQQSGRRPGVLSRIYARAFLQTLAIALTLSGALVRSEPPLLAFAAATYTVESNVDAHKDGTFPAADCRSTLTPDHPCTLRAAIETANTASSGAAINVPGNLVIILDATLGELSPNVPMSITSTGGGSAVVDGGLQTRVFHTTDATTGVMMSGLTVRHGKPA